MDVATPDDARDATRRTRLANERTFLAWWRTGLASLAVSLAAGKLVPELSDGSTWPFQLLGIGFALVGLLFIGYAHVRQRQVEDALARGGYAPFEARTGLAFAALGVVLGIGTIAVILVPPIDIVAAVAMTPGALRPRLPRRHHAPVRPCAVRRSEGRPDQ